MATRNFKVNNGLTTPNVLLEESGGNTVTLQPNANSANYSLTLPADDGNSGQYLQTDGNGILTWASIAGSSSIANGNSNVVVTANSNVNISVTGNANVFTVTGTGAVLANAATLTLVSNNGTTLRQTSLRTSTSSAFTANYTLTLPTTSGTNGQVLATDGSGNLSWVSGSPGIANGTSNVNIPLANGAVTIGVDGTSNVFTVTAESVAVTGTVRTNRDIISIGNASFGTSALTGNPTATFYASGVVVSEVLSAAYGAGTFVVTGAGGTAYSKNGGTTWSSSSGGAAAYTVAFGNNIFMEITSGRVAYTSSDGVTWAIAGTATGSAPFRTSGLAYGNGVWMMVGGIGTSTVTCSISSDNGNNWSAGTSPGSMTNSNPGPQMAYGNGTWVVTPGVGNTYYWSQDNGTTWSTGTLAAGNTWGRVAYNPTIDTWMVGVGLAFSGNAFNNSAYTKDPTDETSWNFVTPSGDNNIQHFSIIPGGIGFVAVPLTPVQSGTSTGNGQYWTNKTNTWANITFTTSGNAQFNQPSGYIYAGAYGDGNYVIGGDPAGGNTGYFIVSDNQSEYTVSLTGRINTSVLPVTGNTISLGTTALPWNQVVSNNVITTSITSNNVTATTALNVNLSTVTGISATVTANTTASLGNLVNVVINGTTYQLLAR